MTMTFTSEQLALEDLHRLGKARPPAITILLPGQPRESARSRLSMLKSSVDTVFQRLMGLGMKAHEIARLVAPILSVGEDPGVRDNGDAGIALLVDSEVFYYFEIPKDTRETVAVGTHFYLRPLLDWLTEARSFFVLQLTQGHVTLSRCVQDKLVEVPLPRGVPDCLDEISKGEGPEPLTRVAANNRQKGSSAAISFGMTSANEERRIQFFCAMVDRGLHPLLQEEGIPVVLAGSDRIVATYRNENTYPNTVTDTLRGDTQSLSFEELIAESRRLIRIEQAAGAARHLAEMEEYAPGDRWSTSIDVVVKAAAQGRVWRLFLARGLSCEGCFPPSNGKPGADLPYCEDLLNAAAIETLVHNGEVFLVDPEQLPANASMAALFRYSTGSD